MSEKMLKFVNLDQQSPPKRSVDQRKTDFKEIYDEYINNTKSVFNERLFIEIQRSNSNNQSVENKLIDIAYDRGIPIVATNDIFFESRADHEANDILQCITNADVISNPNRKKKI